MRKTGGIYYPRQKRQKIQKCRCAKCGAELAANEAFYRVDCCNIAITNNARPYCKECYIDKYGN